MPNYKGHIAGGVGAFIVTVLGMRMICTPSPLTLVEWLACTVAGALFPDVDIKSKGQRYGYWIILVILTVLLIRKRFEMLMSVSVLAMAPMLSRHRGLFHRLWFIIAFPLLIWYLISLEFPKISGELFYDTLFFIAGAISHLWLDRGLVRMFQW